MIEYTNENQEKCYVAVEHILRLGPSNQNRYPLKSFIALSDGTYLHTADTVDMIRDRIWEYYREQRAMDVKRVKTALYEIIGDDPAIK